MSPRVVSEFDEAAAVLPDCELHLAIGMFDGVHLGHQAVIQSALHSASRSKGITGVLTFHPHPSRLLSPLHCRPRLMIMYPETKTHVLHNMGVDLVIQKKFDADLADLSAADFINLLKRKLPTISALYVGENFHFGKGRTGDVNFLVNAAGTHGMTAFSVAPIKHNGQIISSTRIRKNLREGRIEEANALLGRTYFSSGTITSGRQVGRELGFPTLNLPWYPELEPCYGVYTVRVASVGADAAGGKRGVANYGVRPTIIQAAMPLLEIHLLESIDAFGAGDTVIVEWYGFLRRERTFSSRQALIEQIARDKRTAQGYWGLP